MSESFTRYIVFCKNCNKYVMPYSEYEHLYCPFCGPEKPNLDVFPVQVMNMEHQKSINKLLKWANKFRKTLCEEEIRNPHMGQTIEEIHEELNSVWNKSEEKIEPPKVEKSELEIAKEMLNKLITEYVDYPEVYGDGSCEDKEKLDFLISVEKFLGIKE